MEPALYIGLMSGTSVDGIDSALVRCAADSIELVATHLHPIPAGVRASIEAISHPGDDEIERLGPLDRELGRLFAAAALALADQAAVNPGEVRAIGSHGQTVRHRPPGDSRQAADCFTLQLAEQLDTEDEFGGRQFAACSLGQSGGAVVTNADDLDLGLRHGIAPDACTSEKNSSRSWGAIGEPTSSKLATTEFAISRLPCPS